jgi:type VI secretion system protein ImpE
MIGCSSLTRSHQEQIMTAGELFQAGKLPEAIDAQVAKVRASPTDNIGRLFLFELFLFAGDLDRARKQLDVLRYDDPRHTAAIDQYRFALEAETHRRAVFAGTEEPKGMATAPDHVRARLEALSHMARGDHAQARKKLDEANAGVPSIMGTLNGKPFTRLFDADERFATVLEVFATGGAYTWLPLELIESISLNSPQNPRDVIFRPAHLVLPDGTEGDVLLPGLYPGTSASTDDLTKLGRSTEWKQREGEVTCGVGGKLFLVDDTLVNFTDLKELHITQNKAAADN